MKKLLLLSTALLTAALIASAQSENAIIKSPPTLTTKNIIEDDTYAKAAAAFFTPQKKNPSPLSLTVVGFTQYDLQCNNSMSRRIINHADGTISMAWTIDDAGGTWPNRGTGWNYWNGTSLLYPGGVTTRLETTRTGFTNIGLLGNGKEVVMAHNGVPYNFKIGTNTTKGSSTWTFITANATLQANAVPGWQSGTGTNATQWGKIATGGFDGNSIHLVANYSPTDKDTIQGIQAPFVYSRSQDGGQTWDKKSILLPGYDKTRTTSGGADNYSIDAEGKTIAVLHGGLGEDVTLWKSLDNGDNWTNFCGFFSICSVY